MNKLKAILMFLNPVAYEKVFGEEGKISDELLKKIEAIDQMNKMIEKSTKKIGEGSSM